MKKNLKAVPNRVALSMTFFHPFLSTILMIFGAIGGIIAGFEIVQGPGFLGEYDSGLYFRFVIYIVCGLLGNYFWQHGQKNQ